MKKFLWGDNLLWGWLKILWGNNICYYTTLYSLFHLFRNSYHPENSSASFMNPLRKWDCIRSWYLPISTNLLKKSLRKTSLFPLTKAAVMKKVFYQLHISSCYCNSCNQNIWKIFFKFSFRTHFSRYWLYSVIQKNLNK